MISRKTFASLFVLNQVCICIQAEPLRQVRPIFEDPFDMGAGGTVLTWATQEGMMINNPALLPYGGKLFRWLGSKSIFAPGTDIDALQAASSSSSAENTDGQTVVNPIDALFTAPLHVGVGQALSFITNNFGITALASATPDLRAWRRGTLADGGGTSQLQFRAESYAGVLASTAARLPEIPWLSLGLTAKQLTRLEVNQTLDIVSVGSPDNISSLTQSLLAATTAAQGTGIDIGSLIFLQGRYLDFRLAAVQANLGGLNFSDQQNPIPSMLNTGVGLSFHNEYDAIHLALDLRDVQGATTVPTYKKASAGIRIMLRGFLGLSAGIYHGMPSYGAAIDFFVFRIAASVYTREYLKTPGSDRRSITMLAFVTGTDF